jgi:hypothetical protein
MNTNSALLTREQHVGFYQNQVLPRFQDKVMDRKPMREVRVMSANPGEAHCTAPSSATLRGNRTRRPLTFGLQEEVRERDCGRRLEEKLEVDPSQQ